MIMREGLCKFPLFVCGRIESDDCGIDGERKMRDRDGMRGLRLNIGRAGIEVVFEWNGHDSRRNDPDTRPLASRTQSVRRSLVENIEPVDDEYEMK